MASRNRTRLPAIRTIAACLLAFSASPLLTGTAAAQPDRPSPGDESSTLPLRETGDHELVLRGAADRSQLSIQVPPGWSQAALRIELAWRASSALTSPSSLNVSVGGTPRAATVLEPGKDDLVAETPLEPVDDSVVLDIAARMRTRHDECPPPDAPEAFVAIDPDSRLHVSGRRTQRPVLSDVPQVLVQRIGDRVPPLLVLIPPDPTPAVVQAAILVAGAVSRETGFPGVPVEVRVASDGSDALVQDHPGPVLRVERDPRAPRVALSPRDNSPPTLQISGREDGLVRAAWAVARHSRTASLEGREDLVVGEIRRPVETPEPVEAVPLPESRIAGTGSKQVELPFRIPARAVVEDPGRLRLRLFHATPAGGEVKIAVNGFGVRDILLEQNGRATEDRTVVREEVPARVLQPGDNTVTLRTDLAAAAAGRCAPLDGRPSISIGPDSRVELTTRPRREQRSLGLWPYPFDVDPTWSETTVVLPEQPTTAELAALVEALAEAARWTGQDVLPRIVFGRPEGGTVPRSHLIVLTRGRAPPWLDLMVDRDPVDGLLLTTGRDEGVALMAVAPRALRPLGEGFFMGRVQGRVALVDERGRVELLEAAPSEPGPPRRLLTLVLVAAGALLLLLLTWGAVRRFRGMGPPPGHGDRAATSRPPDDAGFSQQDPGERWRDLAAEEDAEEPD